MALETWALCGWKGRHFSDQHF